MITKVVAPERDCPIALRGQLTSAISPNVGNSIAQFLLVGICVRANPLQFTTRIVRIKERDPELKLPLNFHSSLANEATKYSFELS